MTDHKTTWERVRGWYHYPALKDPQVVKKLDGGACYDFSRLETLVDEGFVKKVSSDGGIPEESVLEGIFAHEIGHYMVFPRNLATIILAAKMIDDFFGNEDTDVRGFIFQTYADMANDTASVLEEQRTEAILGVRRALQSTMKDPVNRNIREVMMSYLLHQAGRDSTLPKSIAPFKEKMLEIDFLDPDVNKMRLGLWTFGNIITDMIKKFEGKGGRTTLILDHIDSDIRKWLRGASEGDIKDALREISWKIGRKEYERVREWLRDNGVKLRGPPQISPLDTSEGKLDVDAGTVEYYKGLSMGYPLIVTKKLLETEDTTRSWSDTKKWRPGDDPALALPSSSAGLFLPGVTRSIRIDDKPMRTTDYKAPHLLVVVDSSGSMPDPRKSKSYAALGGVCGARSYHLHGSSVGVINFSGKSFYLPYTRNLDEALGAICAYQGGGTSVDVDMVRKMLGPEMAELYARRPESAVGRLPKDAIRKEVSLSVPQFSEAFAAESIDVVMLTDGGIGNLAEVLDLFEEKAQLNRATIVIAHGFEQELKEMKDRRINVLRVDEDKDMPNIVIKETQGSLSSLSEGIRR
jgi:hypothetical protein